MREGFITVIVLFSVRVGRCHRLLWDVSWLKLRPAEALLADRPGLLGSDAKQEGRLFLCLLFLVDGVCWTGVQ